MKKIFSVIMPSLILLVAQMTCLAAEIQDIPRWVKELQSNASRVFHTEVKLSSTNIRDHLNGKDYIALRLQGEGSLGNIPNPFEVMGTLFLSNGWREDLHYAADGHGSSSIAYRKGPLFCVTSVQIDSGCDDEETGHVPSKFWFSIDCRESRTLYR